MPPKAKFTREQIAQAGVDIIRTDGFGGLTARALGKRLGSSACPIFTVFKDMEDVQAAVKTAARAVYAAYVERGLEDTPAFKGVGMQYILFAMKEPRLFQLLFMSEQPQKPAVADVLPVIEDRYEVIRRSVEVLYGLGEREAERLYRHLWIYTHGIAVLCATNMCTFTPEETGRMLTEVCMSILKEIKGESAP